MIRKKIWLKKCPEQCVATPLSLWRNEDFILQKVYGQLDGLIYNLTVVHAATLEATNPEGMFKVNCDFVEWPNIKKPHIATAAYSKQDAPKLQWSEPMIELWQSLSNDFDHCLMQVQKSDQWTGLDRALIYLIIRTEGNFDGSFIEE